MLKVIGYQYIWIRGHGKKLGKYLPDTEDVKKHAQICYILFPEMKLQEEMSYKQAPGHLTKTGSPYSVKAAILDS